LRFDLLRYELMHLWMMFNNLRFLNIGIDDKNEQNIEQRQNAIYKLMFSELEKVMDRQENNSELINVLEIGAGLSPCHDFAKEKRGWRFHTMDACRVAVLRAKISGYASKRGLISCLPLPEKTLNAICAIECFCTVSEIEQRGFYQEMHRVLKPEGVFVSVDYSTKQYEQFKMDLLNLCEQQNMHLLFIKDLSSMARESIQLGELERASIFKKLPAFVRNSDFGKSISESLYLKGTRQYHRWVTGEKSYVIYGLGLKKE